MNNIERTREIIRKANESSKQRKTDRKNLNASMNKILNKTISKDRFEKQDKEKWNFEHNELTCTECNEGVLSFYLGTVNGEEAHKYVCSECEFEEVTLIKDL
jgi:Zn finger protein HypA/HybF involved in hydrogenase expression